ncbi:MAG: 50S ribosomal protein L10 [Candidatus Parcubacteria bacterium]|nr:50S ribosomal protein L10 [Candidatus Parcubacteria bacterium]
MLTKKQKTDIVKDLSQELDGAKGIYFLGFHGLTMNHLNALKPKLKESQTKVQVVKKTLANLALSQKDFNMKDVRNFNGSLFMLISKGDILAAAKTLWAFAARNDKVSVLGGVIDNKFITKEEVITLAKLPTREILLGRVVGGISSPLRNFVWIWQSQINKMVYVLEAIKTKK